MKIIINDDIKMIIFLNTLYLDDINFENKEDLEVYFQNLLKKLSTYYKININGYYLIDVYIDNNYGVVLELKKEEVEYFGYFEDEVEIQIIIHKNNFIYEIEDYFWIDEKIKEHVLIYKFNNKLYVSIKDKIGKVFLGKIIENSKIKYKLDNKMILKEKNLVTI